MRYLITGGAGFIGSHLSDLLLEQGHSVHVLDDLSTGRLENVAQLDGHPDFACTIGSVADERLVAELVADTDAVVHLAAAVGVRLVVERPVRAIETNVHCTEVVLAHADEQQKPVMVASTSEVYGKSDALPFREDGDLQLGATSKARWAYACSKAIDEFARRIIEQTGSSSEIVTIPYEEVYGEGFEDMFRRVPDIAKINSWTGWSPSRSLDEIIGDVADDLRRAAGERSAAT